MAQPFVAGESATMIVLVGSARRSARQRRALCVLDRRRALARRSISVGHAARQRRRLVRDRPARGTRDRRRPPARSASDARAFLMVGVLGGFTTFSSFSLETLKLARSGALGAAGANVALSLVLCLGGVWLGFVGRGAVQSLRLSSRCRSHALASKLRGGEVPEWPNGLDSKSSVRVIVPWVRIPPSPPRHLLSNCFA